MSTANSAAKTVSPTTTHSGRGVQLDDRQVPPVFDLVDPQRGGRSTSACSLIREERLVAALPQAAVNAVVARESAWSTAH